MKITVLVDNHTYIDHYYLAEPATSYYIEIDDCKILFDAGYSDVVCRNAHKMNLDLTKCTHLVLSHGHNDHTGGLAFLPENPNCKLICHPNCLECKRADGLDISSSLNAEQIACKFKYQPTTTSIQISEHCYFMTEIPRVFEFEQDRAIGEQFDEQNQCWIQDTLQEDGALVCVTDEGLVVIVGCAHSGICNILQAAKEMTGIHQIKAVLGGFHLLRMNQDATCAIEQLRHEKIETLYPCHCVSFEVKMALAQVHSVKEVGVGLQLEFDEG